MALTGDTGNGATLTLPGSYSVAPMTVEIGAETLAMIDISTLATTSFMEKIPSDLKDSGELTITYKWASNVAAPTLGTAATTTITFPLWGALTNAATYSGTGVITSWKPPRLANGELMVGELKIMFDGDTGPTFTAAS